MNCCGSKRANWREYSKRPAPAPCQHKLQNPGKLYYTGGTSFVTKGSVTGYSYLFSGSDEDGLAVDERDIPAFLETDKFRLMETG